MLWNDSGRGTVDLLVIFGQSASIVLVRVPSALERPEFQIPEFGLRNSGLEVGLQKKWNPFLGEEGLHFFLKPELQARIPEFRNSGILASPEQSEPIRCS